MLQRLLPSRFDAPFAQPTDPVGDGFLDWEVERKKRLSEACTQRRPPALVSTVVGVREHGAV